MNKKKKKGQSNAQKNEAKAEEAVEDNSSNEE